MLNKIIRNTLVASHIPSELEPGGMFRGDGKRPNGVSLIPWKRGRCVVWDATVPHTLANSHVAATCLEAGAAAKKAEATKTA